MRHCNGNNRCSRSAAAKRPGLVALVMILPVAWAASAQMAAAQAPPTVDRVVGIDVLNPHGGVGERGVRSLGFVAGEELVVAKLGWNPEVFSNDPGFYAVTLGSEVFQTSVLIDYDEATGLALLRVPGLRARPYVFARSTGPPGAVTAIVGYATPDRSAEPDQPRYQLDSLVLVSGRHAGPGPAGTVTHDAFVAGHLAAGSPMFNGCGEVVGATFDLVDDAAAGIPAANLASLFDADWEPTTAAGDCARTAVATQVSDPERAAQLSNMIEVYQDSVALLREKEAELRITADTSTLAADSARAVADSLKDLADSLQEKARETGAELGELRERDRETGAELGELRVERSKYLLRVGIALAIAAVALVLVVFGLRSARRSRERADQSDSAAARAKSEVAKRRAKERYVGQFPSLFIIQNKGDRPGDIAVRVPGRVIAAEGGAVVGRSPRLSAVVIDHEAVSRRHFRLSARGKRVQIEDLNTTNGTTVNGVRLVAGKAVSLAHGAEVGIGPLTLTVTYR